MSLGRGSSPCCSPRCWPHRSALADPRSLEIPGHHLARGFRNLDPRYDYTILGRTVSLLRRAFQREPARGALPLSVPNDGAALRANGSRPTVTWIGHATLLVQLDGVNILTDPIWSDHAGPFGIGPRRLVPPGVRFAGSAAHPRGAHLARPLRPPGRAHRPAARAQRTTRPSSSRWGCAPGWPSAACATWSSSTGGSATTYRGLTFVATPAQHGSGRTLADQNLRLWSSWAVLGRDRRFFFAGDTGYTPALAEIGKRLGPFDVAAIPIGGYSAYTAHHPNHVSPEEGVQLFEDVRGRLLVPMHWGTFALNREPFREPPERLLAEALRRGLEERIALLSQGQSIHW